MREIRFTGEKASGGTPVQAETIAYLASLSTFPSEVFRTAVNKAIYDLKALGVWGYALHLPVFCGANLTDSLRSLTGASHATTVGSLTHTAYKGFSGFGATKGLVFGGLTVAAMGTTPTVVSAYSINGVGGGGAYLTVDDAGATDHGSTRVRVTNLYYPSGDSAGFPLNAAPTALIAGGRGTTSIVPGAAIKSNSPALYSDPSNNPRTYVDASVDGALVLFAGHWIFNSSVTQAQASKIALIFANLIHTIGALD